MPVKPYQMKPAPANPIPRTGMILRITRDIGQESKVGDYLVVVDTDKAINITQGHLMWLYPIKSGNMRVVEVTLQEVQQ